MKARIELDDGTTLNETVRRVKRTLTEGLDRILPETLVLTPAMVATELKAAHTLLAPWYSFSWTVVKERALAESSTILPARDWLAVYVRAPPTTLAQREDAALENLARLAATAMGLGGSLTQLFQKHPTAAEITALARTHTQGDTWFPSLTGAADGLTVRQMRQLADAMPREGVPVPDEDDTMYRTSLHQLVRHFVGNHFIYIKQMYLGRCWARYYPDSPLTLDKPQTLAWLDLLRSFTTPTDPTDAADPSDTKNVADAKGFTQLVAVERATLVNMLVSRFVREDLCGSLDSRVAVLGQLEHSALYRPLRAVRLVVPDEALRLWAPLQSESQRLLRLYTCEDSFASLRSLTQSFVRHTAGSAAAALTEVCHDAALRCFEITAETQRTVVVPHNDAVKMCLRTAVRAYRTAQAMVTHGIRMLLAGVKDFLHWSPVIRDQPLTAAQLASRALWHRLTTLHTCGCSTHIVGYATCLVQHGVFALVRRLPEVYVQLAPIAAEPVSPTSR
jgi:hypothetical protein